MKLYKILFFIIFLASCTNIDSQSNKNDSKDKYIGWLHGNCLAIKNTEIAAKTNIKLIRLESNKTEEAIITSKAKRQEECFPLIEDRKAININNGYTFYLINSTVPIDLAIGVIGPQDLNDFSFRSCNTSEGVKFFVNDSSDVIWEGYYYLGYDSEPTCDF